jgi:hypothetical protein
MFGARDGANQTAWDGEKWSLSWELRAHAEQLQLNMPSRARKPVKDLRPLFFIREKKCQSGRDFLPAA